MVTVFTASSVCCIATLIDSYLVSVNALRVQLNKQNLCVVIVVVASVCHIVQLSVAVTFAVAVAAYNGNKN